MSNLSTALALILAVETPNMNPAAIGDTHLPPARRAYGRMQIRKTVLDDFNKWDHGEKYWTRADTQNPNLDVLMAQRWLVHYCGHDASIRRYLQTWNGGPTGWKSNDARAYFKRAEFRKIDMPEHYKKCKTEVERMIQ